ncbi:MAG: hypothetical protein GAK29_01437 [Acinetobacter bereziniae]|uniref:Uncharacterized protein n=1 Tax=Acinetobacter bereziniae TaxID=106648 RepID=A0A833PG86_ACIBZ|nr:MAG: hypothetical protein GAK29_01437 [Acinetobacter bereziniae]
MKKLLLVCALAFGSLAHADECESLHQLAGTIADARMGGMSQNQALDIAENSELPEIAVYLVNHAYDLDLMGTDKDKRIEVQLFQTEIYIMCKEYLNDL